MRYLNKVNDSAYQRFFLTGNPGQRITMTLRYLPSQQLWSADFVYGDFVLNGIIVTASPNILRNYSNIIPFGIACTTIDGLDPYYLDDFTLQRANLFLLTRDEVQAAELTIFSP